MKLATHHSAETAQGAATPPSWPIDFVPLHLEARTHVSTAVLCCHLGRAAQTLRIWACKENGPLRPIRINGRLAWPVAELRRLLGVA